MRFHLTKTKLLCRFFKKLFAKFLLNVKDKNLIQITIFPFSGGKKKKKKTIWNFHNIWTTILVWQHSLNQFFLLPKILWPFNATSLLGCQPLAQHQKIEKNIYIYVTAAVGPLDECFPLIFRYAKAVIHLVPSNPSMTILKLWNVPERERWRS